MSSKRTTSGFFLLQVHSFIGALLWRRRYCILTAPKSDKLKNREPGKQSYSISIVDKKIFSPHSLNKRQLKKNLKISGRKSSETNGKQMFIENGFLSIGRMGIPSQGEPEQLLASRPNAGMSGQWVSLPLPQRCYDIGKHPGG